jgi:acetyl esterase/lipase
MDGTKSHIDLCLDLQRSLDQNGIKLAWFYSTYTLTPHSTYPTQFCEAVETLNYILQDLGRHPSEVILAGDSAGANLCLAILSHMTHPATGVPRLIVQEPLKALALISPWVSFSHNWPSVRRNKHKDIEATDATALWSRIYLDVNPTNYYIEAVHAPEEWWKEAKVQHTLVLAGEDEILVDPITAWVYNFQV